MKTMKLLSLFLCLIQQFSLFSQLSYGGNPLFYSDRMKSSTGFFIEMQHFDVNKMLEEDRLNESGLREGGRFAKKFQVHIERGKSGEDHVLPDGTKVWQVGIRSKGAFSINVLFSEFHIPDGGRVFLYNSVKTHVLGAFTNKNCRDNRLFQVSPVIGDEIVIEYIEPADADFEGRLTIAEVNHDYRNIMMNESSYYMSGEPESDDNSVMFCMPDVLCTNMQHEKNIRSSVLLIVYGNKYGSGVLINNTANDGKPYILTAAHCLALRKGFHQDSIDYDKRAATVIAFFNYNRSICNSFSKGPAEFSLSGFYPLTIIEGRDVALLCAKNDDEVPDYYTPYFAGWNRSANGGKNPYTNIHHPLGSVAKFGLSDKPLSLTDYYNWKDSTLNAKFDPGCFWKVQPWTIGATEKGSSGSPLFDGDGLVIGGLTGGTSSCSEPDDGGDGCDYFFSIHKGWTHNSSNPRLQLKTWLDPLDTDQTSCPGYDPYEAKLVRANETNFNSESKIETRKIKEPESGFLFGHNSLQQLTEFAEEFYMENKADIVGTYILCPAIDSFSNVPDIHVKIYTGNERPEELLDSAVFRPQYVYHPRNSDRDTLIDRGMDQVPTENFVKFDNEPSVQGKFYVSYSISYPTGSNFAVYNAVLPAGRSGNTWLRDRWYWFRSVDNLFQPVSTSLALQPLIRNHSSESSLETIPTDKEKDNFIYYNRANQILHLTFESSSGRLVSVYTINGRLIYRQDFPGNSSHSISLKRHPGVGIVYIQSDENVETNKIIF